MSFSFPICFKVGTKIFVKEDSAGEKGTSFAEMNRTESSNAKKGPAVDYNSFKDFFNSETIAHILAAWMHFAGMQSTDGMKSVVTFFVYSMYALIIYLTYFFMQA